MLTDPDGYIQHTVRSAPSGAHASSGITRRGPGNPDERG